MYIFDYIKLALGFIGATGAAYIAMLVIFKIKGGKVIRSLSCLMCFWSLFLVVFVTLVLFNFPFDFSPERHILNIVPFGRFAEKDINIKKTIISEIIPNILLFVPLGMFIPAAFRELRTLSETASTVFLVTFSIEFFQYFIGRKSDIDDILMNLAGGIIGYGVFKALNYWLKDKKWWNEFIGEK